jgi:hypothetical protein
VARSRRKGRPRAAARTELALSTASLEAAARSLDARIDPVLELFDYLKDVLFWIKDRKGIFRWVNTPLMLDLGKTRREHVIGQTDFDLFEPYLANQYQMDDAQVLKGRSIISRVELIVFNHAPRWIVTSKLPLRAANGRIVGTARRGDAGSSAGVDDLGGVAPGATIRSAGSTSTSVRTRPTTRASSTATR